jgi:hypothetical protein
MSCRWLASVLRHMTCALSPLRWCSPAYSELERNALRYATAYHSCNFCANLKIIARKRKLESSFYSKHSIWLSRWQISALQIRSYLDLQERSLQTVTSKVIQYQTLSLFRCSRAIWRHSDNRLIVSCHDPRSPFWKWLPCHQLTCPTLKQSTSRERPDGNIFDFRSTQPTKTTTANKILFQVSYRNSVGSILLKASWLAISFGQCTVYGRCVMTYLVNNFQPIRGL